MAEISKTPEKPLSPHLQVYRLPMTAKMSILHRMTGAVLVIGTLLVAWVLIAAATSEKAYNSAMTCLDSTLGTIALAGWSVALFYHMCNGIRHMIWDTGRLLSHRGAFVSGLIVLLCAVLLTGFVWFASYVIDLGDFYKAQMETSRFLENSVGWA